MPRSESSEKQEAEETVERFSVNSVLCAFDFSDFSRTALHYAMSLSRHFGAQLYIQHTAELPQMAGAEPSVLREWQNQLPFLEREIAEMIEKSGIDASEARIVVNDGDVLERILETISRQKIDLLVMGTHGRKGIRRLMVGSVAEGAIHRAPCPVLVVSRPEKELPLPEGAELKTILLATDFSKRSDRAVDYALSWACEWAAKVILFHAVPKTPSETGGMVDVFPEYNPYFEKQVASAWQRIRHLVPESVEQWCEVHYEVRHGDPKEEILKVAEEKNADLIIVGARGAGRTAAPWGSVSSAVVREGRFPVLVVRTFRP